MIPTHQKAVKRLFAPLVIVTDAIHKQAWRAIHSVLDLSKKIAALTLFMNWQAKLSP
jgi:hypothetical protein